MPAPAAQSPLPHSSVLVPNRLGRQNKNNSYTFSNQQGPALPLKRYTPARERRHPNHLNCNSPKKVSQTENVGITALTTECPVVARKSAAAPIQEMPFDPIATIN
jgi:hypothetical protein